MQGWPVFLILMVLLPACSTPRSVIPMNFEERLRQDNAIGRQVTSDLEPRLHLKNDADVSVFLRQLALKMADKTKELKDSPLGVLLVSEQSVWRNFSIPGNRIYLSTGLLQTLEFENELAGAIAFELAHLVNRHLVTRVERSAETSKLHTTLRSEALSGGGGDSLQYFGPGGVFTFSSDENLQSVEAAVGIMYAAGIDPRGLVSLWTRYLGHIQYSPYDKQMLERLLESSREAIVSFPPLRNPVVSSEVFSQIKKRIMKL